MEAFVVPIVVLAFLTRLGCEPTQNVYLVDKIDVEFANGEVLGVYCPTVKEPYCPKAPAVLIRNDVTDTGILVHELWHSCQKTYTYKSWGWLENERQAKSIERHWRNTQHK